MNGQSTAEKTKCEGFSSDSSSNSSPTSTITSISWRIIIVLFQFITNLLTVIRNYFWNSDAFSVRVRIGEMKRNEIFRKKDENVVHVQQWRDTSGIVDAFTNTDPLSEHDVSTYGNNLSTVDSGIDSLPISRVNTHETLLEGAEESEMIHTSLEERVRKWCDRNDREQTELGSDVCYVLPTFTRARHNSFAASFRSSMYRSTRQELSIIRHVLRVRNAHRKRSRSAVAVIGIR